MKNKKRSYLDQDEIAFFLCEIVMKYKLYFHCFPLAFCEKEDSD